MHKKLVEEAKQAIAKVHEDTSVSPKTTRDSLKELRDELDTLIDAVECGMHGSDEE